MHRVIEEITIGNDWRSGEFAKYKINSQNVDETLWCRMCIPMIYAHWEGFVVSSMRVLLTYLNELELVATDIPTNLLVVSLGDAYKSLSGKQSFEQRINFTEKFNEILNDKIQFSKKIDTQSNLKSEVLKKICEMFSFDFSRFSHLTIEINRLVNMRNSIAHGENSIVPNMRNIKKSIESIQEAMDIFLDEINIFLTTRSYLLVTQDE